MNEKLISYIKQELSKGIQKESIMQIIGRFTYAAAIISFLTMLALTIVNLDKFSVLFRNVSIILSALALAVQSRKSSFKERVESKT